MHVKIIVANYPSVYTCYTQREMSNSFVDIPNNSPKKFNLILFANNSNVGHRIRGNIMDS